MHSREFHAKRYSKVYVLDELRRSRIEPCLRMVQDESRRRRRSLTVLDAGCGDGTVSAVFLEAGHRVLGVDIVPQFADTARAKGIGALSADVASDGLPLRTAAVDAIYAGALIEHLYDPEFFLRECRRALHDGGLLVLSTPNVASLTSRVRMLLGREPKSYASALSWEFGGHIRMFTAGSLRRLLRENGFCVEEVTSNVVSFLPTRRTRRPWSRALGRIFPGLGEVLIVKARKAT